MKILILGPYTSPIVQRLKSNLELTGEHTVWVASHNIDSDIENRLISLGNVNSFFEYFKFYKVNKIVKELKPDIVHAHILNHYGLMALFQQTPLIVALWGSDVMLALNSKNLFKKLFYKIISFLVASKAKLMHTSSLHVKDEMQKHFSKKISDKINVFYWGFPLNPPSSVKLNQLSKELFKEFDITTDELLVFPRGLAPTYNPDAAVKIINTIIASQITYEIIVLRGFSTDEQVHRFMETIGENIKNIVFINRLLSSEELYCLYCHTKFHFSVPISDALGGGVIEPAQLGSTPILSNILPYQSYLKNNRGFIMSNYSDDSLEDLCSQILSFNVDLKSEKLGTQYSAANITNQIINIYKIALQHRIV